MRKFISNQQILSKFGDQSLVDLLQPFQSVKGSLKYQEIPELPLLTRLSPTNVATFGEFCYLVPPVREGCLEADELAAIESTSEISTSEPYGFTDTLEH